FSPAGIFALLIAAFCSPPRINAALLTVLGVVFVASVVSLVLATGGWATIASFAIMALLLGLAGITRERAPQRATSTSSMAATAAALSAGVRRSRCGTPLRGKRPAGRSAQSRASA